MPRSGCWSTMPGMSLNGTLATEDPANVARLIALNITAPTMLAAAATRAFPDRGGGAIVMIGSVLALVPEQFDGVYSGSKAYMLNLSLSLATMLADKGVLVQAVLARRDADRDLGAVGQGCRCLPGRGGDGASTIWSTPRCWGSIAANG